MSKAVIVLVYSEAKNALAAVAARITSGKTRIISNEQMVVVLTFILAVLITVLMERSFIAKELGEIAFMKAIGTRNGKIYAYHTLRFHR